MKKKELTIEQEIENVISTMPEEVEIQTEAEPKTQEAPQPEKVKEPVRLEVAEDAQPMKRRRRKPRAAAAGEPVEEAPVQILSGETLLELTSIITSRAAALVISIVTKKQGLEMPPSLTADFFALSEQEKKNLSTMADRAAEKMAASGDPIIVFFAGVLTVVGVKGVLGYQMIEAWNKEKKS